MARVLPLKLDKHIDEAVHFTAQNKKELEFKFTNRRHRGVLSHHTAQLSYEITAPLAHISSITGRAVLQ